MRPFLPLLAAAAACTGEGIERCPTPFSAVWVEDARDAESITGTTVDCGAGLGSFCADPVSWSVDLGGGCSGTKISICKTNFTSGDCLELFLEDDDIDGAPTGARLVFQDDVGDGVDAVCDALGGHFEVAGFDGDVRGRFDLAFEGGGTVRGTFVHPSDAGP